MDLGIGATAVLPGVESTTLGTMAARESDAAEVVAESLVVGSTWEVVTSAKISASWKSAERWVKVKAGSGEASVGWRRAASKSCAAAVARSREEVAGIDTWEGYQVSVSAMRSADVLLIHTR